ncbi:MAG: UDP-N-acetylmuramoyl-tripeptide--D-alanyl-D-alanine ligase [Gemmatimonadota bacterium]|nr:UDP-N-acetylmuramoyl-tripeptide--D-alanyl-D-alanine ligase [Gemmatimonadota bacterium]MDH3367099.1 UDP-N-acetylmuramoyl-tripeptide--D-alanyl-D-alanine ligase [Gemmatimonadota bacterium]MDH3477842.1 UDP-N-acetylmuramoyl-tripeptide--D-alanyl-D-alanine ligase [Gemmatimonadota bacterium]MDH3571684.1 UDP-N-acetylmuramoyl-tripeptide--D-alanyl-D-alanine ligase [Gemmatimonadota bacterium]MDH5551154.1 UDP-N-acetylmuramoyl-tripeptide--D-alanyl-D-alanine ligase [Gemmatimonadota bacterium]
MSPWTGERVARALGVAPVPPCQFSGIGTDTRTLAAGALFVALVGERFDGHRFLDAALAAGATGAVVRQGTRVPDGLVGFAVDDTLAALGALARERRRSVPGPVVAVTGTNGKTATKEMLARVVGVRWSVHATRGNLNNLVGVPLTILAAPDTVEALVVEAGASIPGEVARLRAIIEPSVGVVTNVAAGHLEGFGSVAGVLAEKVSLLEGVPTAVVGTTPPELAREARRLARRVVVAGTAAEADIVPTNWDLDAEGRARIRFRAAEVRLPLIGRHQVDNAMVALAVAVELGIDLGRAARALETLTLPSGRCEIIRRGALTVINDAYNANPDSVRAALETAAALRGTRSLVVVLGTMLELGNDSAALHEQVAAAVVRHRPTLVGVTGAFVAGFDRWAAELGDRLIVAEDPATLGRRVADRLSGDEVVLVKASRGVRLEQAIPFIIPG